jgi:hypothetical protein
MQLYILAARKAHMEVLCRYRPDFIAGHFSAKCTLELVARKYYLPGMVRKVKAYTPACLTCQRVRPVRHRPHGGMELLSQPRGPWTDVSVDFIVGLPLSCQTGHTKSHNALPIVVD